jgi:hypothetical protein
VPPRITAVPSRTAATARTQRDRRLRCIAENGRMAWQIAAGYNRRAKVAAAIGRWKQVIGDGLRSRIGKPRVTEVNVAVHALNRMLRLAPSNYVRISCPQRGVGVGAPTPQIHAPRWPAAVVEMAEHGSGRLQQKGRKTRPFANLAASVNYSWP